jgi:hypothetical protein
MCLIDVSRNESKSYEHGKYSKESAANTCVQVTYGRIELLDHLGTYSRIELLEDLGTYSRIELLEELGTYSRILSS